MKIAIGCDHGGFILKAAVVEKLNELGHEVVDCGTDSDASVDYPVYGEKVANLVASKECDCGVLLCGTGIGISITANKVKGIRAAVVDNLFCAQACKEHNNANIISMGGRVVRPELAQEIVELWLKTEYAGGRHQRRLDMIAAVEDKNFKESFQKGYKMIQDVINNITSAENEAEEIIRLASQNAKDIRMSAENTADAIAKKATEDCKEAAKMRARNAEVAANKKTDQIFKDGNKEINDFANKCRNNSDEAVKVVTDKLLGKYVNR